MATPSRGRCFCMLSITFSRGVAFKASRFETATASRGLLGKDVFLASKVAS